jgi:sugar (pentulose or hexulose) kinase
MCLIGLDLGSSAVRAVALSVDEGHLIACAEIPTPVNRDHETVEVNAQALQNAVELALQQLVAALPSGTEPVGLATTSVGEAGAPVSTSGEILHNVIWWQDQRSARQVEDLVNRVGTQELESNVGHPPDPTWGIGHVMWLRDECPDVYSSMRAWLPVADLATFWLSGELVTTPSLASRFMAWDQTANTWSSLVLDAGGLDAERLPTVRPSGTAVGTITRSMAERTGLPMDLPIVLGGHDRQCGAFAARQKSRAPVDSAGTSEALLLSVSAEETWPISGTGISRYADVVPDTFTYSARIGLAGGLLDWAKDVLFGSVDMEYEAMMDGIRSPYEFTGVVATPTFGRYSSPHWAPGSVPGTIHGLTTAHTRANVIQGLLEAPAFALRATLDLLDSWSDHSLDSIRVEGGIVKNRPWLQVRADITNRRFLSIEQPHMTALGAALLAGVGSTTFGSFSEASSALKLDLTEWTPNEERAKRYDEAFQTVVEPLARFGANQSANEIGGHHGVLEERVVRI